MGSLLIALQLISQLEPLAEAVVPLVSKALNGQQLNDADLEQLDAATQQLNAAVAAKAAAASQ